MGGLRFLGQSKVVGPGRRGAGPHLGQGRPGRRRGRRRRRDRAGPAGAAPPATSGVPSCTRARSDRAAVRVALLTYSTRPRGGVVHTLALAEALAARGHAVDVWTPGPRRRRRVLPAGRPGGRGAARAVPRRRGRDGRRADPALDPRAGRGLRRPRPELRRRARAGLHHRQRRRRAACAPSTTSTPSPPPSWPPATSGRSSTPSRTSASRPRWPRRCGPGWGSRPTVIPNGVDAGPVRRGRAAGRPAAPALAPAARPLRRSRSAASNRARAALDLVEAMALVQRRRARRCGWSSPAARRCSTTATTGRACRPAPPSSASSRCCSGRSPHDELPALVAAAAGFAFPSIKEGFGMAAMEALAAGRAGGHARPAGAARGLRRRGRVRVRRSRSWPPGCSRPPTGPDAALSRPAGRAGRPPHLGRRRRGRTRRSTAVACRSALHRCDVGRGGFPQPRGCDAAAAAGGSAAPTRGRSKRYVATRVKEFSWARPTRPAKASATRR